MAGYNKNALSGRILNIGSICEEIEFSHSNKVEMKWFDLCVAAGEQLLPYV